MQSNKTQTDRDTERERICRSNHNITTRKDTMGVLATFIWQRRSVLEIKTESVLWWVAKIYTEQQSAIY